MFFNLLFSFALAACPTKFGIQQANGSWSFYPEKVPGAKEVEVDAETCEPIYRALKPSGDKFITDKTLVAAAKAEIAKEKFDAETKVTERETKLARAKVLTAKGANRTLAESNELIDLQSEFLILLWQKAK